MKKILLPMLLIASLATPALGQTGKPPVPGAGKEQRQTMMREEHEEHGHKHGEHERMKHLEKMGEPLCFFAEKGEKMGLSGEQMGKMKPVHLEMHKKQLRFKADLEIAQIELQAIMEPKDFDLEQAQVAVKKITGIQEAHHLEMLHAAKEMRSILTDEQFRLREQDADHKCGKKHHQ